MRCNSSQCSGKVERLMKMSFNVILIFVHVILIVHHVILVFVEMSQFMLGEEHYKV